MENVCCENAKTETYILATVTPQMYKVRGKKTASQAGIWVGFLSLLSSISSFQ